jgi:malate dehydrogenase (oxaloacetate-decarboxylating)(NADP+)
VDAYIDYLYERLQRKGFLFRDVQRLIHNDRNHFAATAWWRSATRMQWSQARPATIRPRWRTCAAASTPSRATASSACRSLCRGRTVLVADTAVHDMPTAEELADIAVEAGRVARRLGYEPRVAMLAYSTFGQPTGERSERVREAVKILDRRRVDFEYDGEMAADVALNPQRMEQYPFCRLSGTANVLVMPAIHSASISTRMLQELGGGDRDRPASGRARQIGADHVDGRQGFRHRQHGGARRLQRGKLAVSWQTVRHRRHSS